MTGSRVLAVLPLHGCPVERGGSTLRPARRSGVAGGFRRAPSLFCPPPLSCKPLPARVPRVQHEVQ